MPRHSVADLLGEVDQTPAVLTTRLAPAEAAPAAEAEKLKPRRPAPRRRPARLRLLCRGRRYRLSGREPRRKDCRGLVDLAEQVGDTLPGHQLTSFPAAIRPRSSSSSVCTRLTSSRTFAAYRPLNWMTVCRLACAVEYAR